MLIEPFSVTPTSPPVPSVEVLWAKTPREPSPTVPTELVRLTLTAPPGPTPLKLWAKTPSESAPWVVMVLPPREVTVTPEAVPDGPARLWA